MNTAIEVFPGTVVISYVVMCPLVLVLSNRALRHYKTLEKLS